MKTKMFVLALSLGLMGCNGQETKNEKLGDESAQTEIKKEQREPLRGNWKVTRELDENGNVVKYDSVYTYSYSTLNGEEANIEDVDSLIRSFQHYFRNRIPPSWNGDFWNPMLEDSTVEEDFFRDDFFQDRWRADLQYMDKRMKHMDSLRDQFFNKFYPGLIESRERRKDSVN